jgi:hypothetical protein
MKSTKTGAKSSNAIETLNYGGFSHKAYSVGRIIQKGGISEDTFPPWGQYSWLS